MKLIFFNARNSSLSFEEEDNNEASVPLKEPSFFLPIVYFFDKSVTRIAKLFSKSSFTLCDKDIENLFYLNKIGHFRFCFIEIPNSRNENNKHHSKRNPHHLTWKFASKQAPSKALNYSCNWIQVINISSPSW